MLGLVILPLIRTPRFGHVETPLVFDSADLRPG